MITKKYTIEISGNDEAKIKELANLMQFALDNTDNKDLVQLLKKIESKPSIVKTALKYINIV